jgi:hypothetical protein
MKSFLATLGLAAIFATPVAAATGKFNGTTTTFTVTKQGDGKVKYCVANLPCLTIKMNSVVRTTTGSIGISEGDGCIKVKYTPNSGSPLRGKACGN